MKNRPMLNVFRRVGSAALGACVLSASLASAQTTAPVAPPGSALVLGKTRDADDAPVPYAKLRLRNLNTTKIERRATGNGTGEFSFTTVPGVPYVVEVADFTGRVIAVGDVIVAQSGEVASTVLVVPRLRPPAAALILGTAGSVILAGSGVGITLQPPVSPER